MSGENNCETHFCILSQLKFFKTAFIISNNLIQCPWNRQFSGVVLFANTNKFVCKRNINFLQFRMIQKLMISFCDWIERMKCWRMRIYVRSMMSMERRAWRTTSRAAADMRAGNSTSSSLVRSRPYNWQCDEMKCEAPPGIYWLTAKLIARQSTLHSEVEQYYILKYCKFYLK